MSTGGDGAIFAEIALSLGQMQAQVDKAVQLSGKVGKALKDIPDAKPTLNTQTLEAGAAKATGILGQLTAALGPGLSAAAGPAQQVLAQATEGMTKVGTASTLASSGLGLAAGGLTAAAGLAATAGVALLKLGQSYEAGFRQIAARTGETGDALKGLEASLTALGTRSIAPTEKIAAVMIQVRQRTGEVGAELETTSLAMLKYAKATGSDAVEATGSLLRIFNAFHIAVVDQKDAMDAFVKVQQTTGISDTALREGIQATGAIFRGYGLDIKETAAIIGILDEAGINAQQVTAGLRRALGNITGPDAKAQLFGLIADLGAMDDKELATARATDLFGTRSAAAILDMARNGKLNLASMNEALAGHEGAVDTAADALKSAWDKIGLQIKRAEKEWTPTAILMAEAASDFATATLDAMGRAGRAIDDFLSDERTHRIAEFLLNLSKIPGAVAGAIVPPSPTAPLTPQEQLYGVGRFAGPSPLQGPADALGQGAANLGAAALDPLSLGGGDRGVASATQLKDLERIHQEYADGVAADNAAIAASQADVDAAIAASVAQILAWGEANRGVAKVQDDGAAATQRVLAGYLVAKAGVVDYAGAIAAAGSTHQAFLESTLREQEASDHLTKSIAAMTDTREKAVAITLQHAAADATGAERAALFAQAEAVAKAGTDSRLAGLQTLAGAILPQLSAAEAAYVKELEASKDPQAEAAFLAAKFGVSVDELNAKLAGSGASLAEFAKQQAAANRPLAEFVSDETKSRISGVLSTLSAGVDAATAALAKQAAESGHADDALRLLLEHAGAGAAFGPLKEGLEAGGAAAFDAREKIAALVTYVRDQAGNVRLKIDVDIENVGKGIAAAQAAIGTLQQNFQQANAARATVETKATQARSEETTSFAANLATIDSTLNATLESITAARHGAADQMVADLATSTAALNKGLASVSAAEQRAQRDFATAVTDAAVGQQVAFINAKKTYQDGVKAIQDQTTQAIEAAANAQAGALRTLSAAMTSFNQQQVQNAFSNSVALQTAQNAANGFTDTQSVASAVRSAQVQQEGAAGLAQANQATALAQAQQSVAQQQLDATKALSKAMEDAAKQMAALAKAQQAAETAARVAAGNAVTQADRAASIAAIGQEAYDASHVSGKAVRMIDGVPYVVETDTLKAAVGDVPAIGGTVGARLRTEQQAKDAADAAIARNAATNKKLDDAELAAREAAIKATDKLIKDEARAKQAFDEAERQRREDQTRADKQHTDALKVAHDQLKVQQDMLAALLKQRGGGQINGPVTIQETSKEMLQYASTRAPAVLKV